jgi:hypothetical protein
MEVKLLVLNVGRALQTQEDSWVLLEVESTLTSQCVMKDYINWGKKLMALSRFKHATFRLVACIAFPIITKA